MSNLRDLSDDEKELLRKNFKNTPTLKKLVDLIFPGCDPRSKQGRLVRRFLVDEGCNYDIVKTVQSSKIFFTPEQKEIMERMFSEGKSSLVVARKIYNDDSISSLSTQQRAVLNYQEQYNGDDPIFKKVDAPPVYNPPRSIINIISRVNEALGMQLDSDKLTREENLCNNRLLINMKNSRFVIMAASWKNMEQRTLFEHEFIRLTWGKPDLTPDEINLYMTMCRDIVSLETINRHLQKLNNEFEECGDKNEMQIKLAEMIKAKSSELNSTTHRIEGMMKKLQGDRIARLDKKKGNFTNFLSIVQAWQNEEDRRGMIAMADLQRQAVKEEANRIESMSEFKARVLGLDKETLI